MKCIIKGMVLGLALLPLSASASSLLAEQKVKYQGETVAIGVCKSVIADNPDELRQLLRQHRSTLLSSYQYDLTSDAVAGIFRCNDMALSSFADEIGADNVSTYLSTGVVAMEELMSSAK